jgi:nitrogen fixation protein NifU and related proteins
MLYSKQVMEHFKNPKNLGELKKADVVGQVGNPICGDIMKLYLKIKENKIKDIGFETLGCGAAIACSSVVTEEAKGKTLEKALEINKDVILKKLGGLPESKIHCSMLAIEALKKAIENYKKDIKS